MSVDNPEAENGRGVEEARRVSTLTSRRNYERARAKDGNRFVCEKLLIE